MATRVKPRSNCVICLAVATLLASLAGCLHGGPREVHADELPDVVLQPSDLPAEFERFDEGKQLLADARPGRREDAERFGREGGWKARYNRPGSPAVSGPLVVESRADLFADPSGAEQDLEAYEAELRKDGDLVEPPPLGEEAVAGTLRQQAFPEPVRFYTVAWREANVTASVLVQGFEGQVTLDDALALARKQQRRIEAAADG